MPLVLDASAALSWIFADERNTESQAIARAVLDEGAIVPALWRWEVQNALVVAQRRGRITDEASAAALAYLAALQIEIEPIGPALIFGSETETAKRFNLSAYDAAYIELALRRGTRIATLDGNLARTAEALKIRWEPVIARSTRKRRKTR